jgi:hypothetical protein
MNTRLTDVLRLVLVAAVTRCGKRRASDRLAIPAKPVCMNRPKSDQPFARLRTAHLNRTRRPPGVLRSLVRLMPTHDALGVFEPN